MLLSREQELENGDERGRKLWKQTLSLLSAAYHRVNVATISAVTTIVTGIFALARARETASRIKHAFFAALLPFQDFYKPATSP